MTSRQAVLIAVTAFAVGTARAQPSAVTPNAVLGTWRMVSATLEENGRAEHPYGLRPMGMVVFTADMHFVEVLTDPGIARFASEKRGEGSDAENRRAMAGSIGFFGTYIVDPAGQFSGNHVDGATFPNWVGGVRTPRELQLSVNGDRMLESFTRPGGGLLRAEYRRVE
jgi:hypothetical protein